MDSRHQKWWRRWSIDLQRSYSSWFVEWDWRHEKGTAGSAIKRFASFTQCNWSGTNSLRISLLHPQTPWLRSSGATPSSKIELRVTVQTLITTSSNIIIITLRLPGWTRKDWFFPESWSIRASSREKCKISTRKSNGTPRRESCSHFRISRARHDVLFLSGVSMSWIARVN